MDEEDKKKDCGCDAGCPPPPGVETRTVLTMDDIKTGDEARPDPRTGGASDKEVEENNLLINPDVNTLDRG